MAEQEMEMEILLEEALVASNKAFSNSPPSIEPVCQTDVTGKVQWMEYLAWLDELPTSVNRRRKELQRNVATFESEHGPNVSEKAAAICREMVCRRNLSNHRMAMVECSAYVPKQVEKILGLLVEYGFAECCGDISVTNSDTTESTATSLIEPTEITTTEMENGGREIPGDADKRYKRTELGEIAASISEVPGILMARALGPLLEYELDAADWCVLLACLTSGNVVREGSSVSTGAGFGATGKSNDRTEWAEAILTDHFRPWISRWRDWETSAKVESGIRWDELGGSEVAELVNSWCGCETEEDCKWVLSTLPVTISIGDFCKLCLKVIATAKQIETVLRGTGELGNGDTKWMSMIYGLSGVERCLSKFVVSASSLYV
jgi:hypothetical protein